ncbi:MAG: transposase [Candidatus Midichloria sp.]
MSLKTLLSVAKRLWFFEVTLHLVINEYGEIQKVVFTTGNVDDRVVVPNIN